ncbi:MAG: Hpt domain-containing protein [Burkholderiaceae bacterium]|nr:Hpt domain-containing protein [Burkholderiaceae bacterium]
MTIDISQFFQVFFDEAEELLAEMERLLLAVDVDHPDPEDLNAVFRTAHSVKGGASTFGITDMTEVTHILETLLDRVRKGEMPLTAEHVDAFLAAKDILKMQLDGHRHGSSVDQDAVGNVRMMLQSLAQDVPLAAMAPMAPSFHTAETKTVDHSGGRRYRFELPAMAHREVQALGAELGLMGHVAITPLDHDRNAMLVTTHESLDDLIAICSFVLNPDDMKVTELPALDERQAGLEQAERAKVENELGYGFFDNSELQPAGAGAGAKSGEGYGFFQPLDEIRANAQDSSDDARGYGFFQPVEQIRAVAGIVEQAPTAQQLAEEEKKAAKKEEKAPVAAHAPGAESSSIRVSIEKVDQLINLVGELVITQAMIEQRVGILDPMKHERLLNGVSQLTRNTRDLQEAVMSIRMMPMDFVFSRFPRMVRDLAAKLGKKVDFITNGAATELDKGLIERIVDPLTHLVRNSIDHGIEMPAVRRAAGKSDAGRLFLSAAHQGGNIIIEVSDDGGGLNREKILAKAQQNGLPLSENMSDADVWQLIFAPGFSTAEQVTDVSGRGVGMDVVKTAVEKNRGAIHIDSELGKGTKFAIRLPIELSIVPTMLVSTSGAALALPMAVVQRVVELPEEFMEVGGAPVLKDQGRPLPVRSLAGALGYEPCREKVGIVVAAPQPYILAVAAVDGTADLVIKPMTAIAVEGITGTARSAEGELVLVVGLSFLMDGCRGNVRMAA